MTKKSSLQEHLYVELIASGENCYKAQQVSFFVSQCYELLHQAHSELIKPAKWKAFCKKKGATSARKKKGILTLGTNIAETAISGDLSLEANRLLASPKTEIRLFVSASEISSTVPDATTPSDYATGASSKRPDILFLPAALETNLTFAIEAKIVRNATDISNDLLGQSGFGCFTRANDPYESNGVVGLLGYAESTSTASLISSAQTHMTNDSTFKSVHSKQFELKYEKQTHSPHLVISRVTIGAQKVCVLNLLAIELTVA
jgi:hypothetical protein